MQGFRGSVITVGRALVFAKAATQHSIRTATFGIGVGLQGLISVALIPLIANSVSTNELAQWAVIESVLLLSPGLLTLGAHHYFLRLAPSAFLKPSQGVGRIVRVMFWTSCAFAAFAALPLVWAYGAPVGGLIVVNMLIETALLGVQFRARATGKAYRYVWLTAGRSFLFLIVLVICSALNPLTLPLVLSVRAGTSLVIFIFEARRWPIMSEKAAAMSRFLVTARFGFPISLASSLLVAGEAFERALLTSLGGPPSVSEYYLTAKYAGIIGLAITTPLSLTFPVLRQQIRKMSFDEGSRLLSFIQCIALIVAFMASLLMLRLSDVLIPLLGPVSGISNFLVALLIGSTLLKGLSTLFAIGLYSAIGSARVLWASVAALTVDVLVGLMGVLGQPEVAVALGCFFGAAIYFLIIFTRSYEVSRMGLSPKAFVLIAGFALTAIALGVGAAQ